MNKKLWTDTSTTKGLNTLVCAYHNKSTGDFDNIGYVFYDEEKVLYSFEPNGRKIKADSVVHAKKVVEMMYDELYYYHPPSEGEYESD